MAYEISEKNLERLRRLRLLDDDYAKIVFQDERSVQCVLENILDQEVKVYKHETQAYVQIAGGRSIVCDICVLTDKGHIDVEIDNQSSRVTPKRIRYHISALDTHVSTPGMNFDELEDIVVIFICAFDPFKSNEAIYHVQREVKEIKVGFDDGIHIILINGSYIGDDKIGRLIHDFRCSNPNDMYNEELKERSKYFKEEEGGIRKMCEIWDEVKQEGRLEGLSEGRNEGIIYSLKALIKSMNLSIEEAMSLLGLSEEDKVQCRKELIS